MFQLQELTFVPWLFVPQLSYNKKKKLQRSLQCEGFMEPSSRPQELVSTELLEVGSRWAVVQIDREYAMNSERFVQELSHIHGLYGKMKESVFPSTEQSVSSIQLIRKDLVRELRRTVVDFYQWQYSKVRNRRFLELSATPSYAFVCGL